MAETDRTDDRASAWPGRIRLFVVLAFASVLAMSAGLFSVLWLTDSFSEPSITIDDPLADAGIVVAVEGAVVRPGLYDLPRGSRVQHLLDAAGGITPDADLAAINPAERVGDGQRIVIPATAPTAAPSASTQVATEGIASSSLATATAVETPAPETTPTGSSGATGTLDLNTATAAELDTLPGIGPAKAAAIVAYRSEHGPFAAVSELEAVSGISAAMVTELAPLVHV